MTKTLVRGGLRNRRLLAIAIGLSVAAVTAIAWGFWSPGTSAGGGSSSADTVNQGATPTVSATGRTVTVSWGASTLAGGHAVDGYIVKRYNANTNAPATTLSACTGTVAALTCDESNVSPGDWKYTVTPVIGDNWHGPESVKSGTVTVTSTQSLSLTKSNYGTADFPGGNATVTGTASGFDNGESLTYKLDDATSGTTLSGTPSAADGSGNASISVTLPQPSDGAHTIYMVGGNGNQASAGIVVDTVAPTVDAQLSPVANGAGWNSTSPVSVTLSADDGTGSGIKHIKYTTDGTDPTTSGTATTYTTPFNVSTDNTTVKYASTDNADNNSTVGSKLIRIDTTAPDFGTPAITVTETNAWTFASGSTVFYNPTSGNSGSFTVHAPNVADGGSGIDKLNFPALSNVTGGGDVSNPGPYDSIYSWDSSSDATGSHDVTATNVAGLTNTASFTTTPDTTAPSIGAPTVTSGYYNTASVPVALQTATDGGSGVDNASIVVKRDVATLSLGTCGSFPGTFSETATMVGGNDTGVSSGHCYQYEEQVSDNVSNQATSAASSGIAKVDTSAPSFANPRFTISESNPASFVNGTQLFYNPSGTNSGSFTVTANVSDPQSDLQKVSFPSLTNMTGGGDVNNPGPYQTTYNWDNTSTATGAQSTSALNNAGLSASQSFTVTPDTTNPTATITGLPTGSTTGTFTGTRSVADTGGSGVASSTLIRETATLTNNTCGTFGSPTTVANNISETTVATGCYRYTLDAVDNVGNNATTFQATVKVDKTVPTFDATPLTLTSNSSNAFVNGTTVYTNNAVGASFKVKANNVTDGDSGVQKVTFPAITGMSGSGDVTTPNPSTSDYETTYTRTATITAGTKNVTATNNVGGVTANQPFSVVNDTTAPTGGALAAGTGTVTGALSNTLYNSSGNYTLTRTEFAETQSATQSGLASGGSALTVAQGTYSGTGLGSCSSFGSETPVAGAPNVSSAAEGCYRYTLTGTDNVGNAATPVVLTVVVDKTAPSMTGAPANVQLVNGGTAAQAGQLTAKADHVDITFPEPMKVSSICSNWTSGDGNDQTISGVTVTITDGTVANGNNDVLTISGGCTTGHFGSIDLGSNAYISGGNVTFSGSGNNTSKLDYTAATHKLVLSLGAAGGATIGPVITSSTAVYTPNSLITDSAGNAITGTFNTGAVKQF